MKYKDSISQANKKMTQTVILLQQWHLPATPINYAIAYAFISKNNPALNKLIEQRLQSKKAFDDFFINDIYQQYILPQSDLREGIISDVSNVLENIQQHSKSSLNGVENFIQTLDETQKDLASNNKQQIKQGVDKLSQAANALKQCQQQLLKKLASAKKRLALLQKELANFHKKIFTDPLTGLYNRKAMNSHIETWFQNDSDKQIAAIVINVDDIEQLKQKFGPVISNVVLAKVAQKVSSYVNHSGFPVRSSGDEFIILLPDVPTSIAQEIAEKITSGVEKLRFKSTKNNLNLPQVSISLVIDKIDTKENIDNLLQRARKSISGSEEHDDDNLVMC
jgi:diguanylate cyclase